jgi:hypothetical protein
VPSNVLHQDARLYQDEPREVYMIQLLANGMPHDRNDIGDHMCKDVKTFRMTLSELNYDDDVFYLFLQKQKIGAKVHIYL